MTIYKIGNITVHIHGNVNQKNLEEATAKFLKCLLNFIQEVIFLNMLF